MRDEHFSRMSDLNANAGGEVIVSVHRTENPGHAAGAAEHGGGVAWRLEF